MFIPCQLHVKLTGTLGLLSEAWRTLALGFQCVDFVSTHLLACSVGPDDIIMNFPTEMFEQAMKQAMSNWTNSLASMANNTLKRVDGEKIVHQFDYHCNTLI